MPIFVDTRGLGEREISEILERLHYTVERRHIESGDFVFNDIAIERKTISDLCNSVTGGNRHFWEQLKVMKATYKKPLILIEGFIDWDDRLLSSIIISIVEGWGIPYINSTSTFHSAKIIGKIFDRYGTAKTAKIPPPAVRKAKSVKEIKWCMLQCVIGIGGIVAKRILEETETTGLFNLGEYSEQFKKDLKRVKGLNKNSKELLIKVLCNE